MDHAFYGCTGWTGTLVIPDSVSDIGVSAFENCIGLTGPIIIPNSVIVIQDSAFRNCMNLSGSIIIGESVRKIGGHALEGCPISSVTFNAINCTQFGWATIHGFLRRSPLPLTYIDTTLHTLIIGNKVQYIPNYAFKNCLGLTETPIFPNSVVKIGNSAFDGCTGLTGSLVFSDSVRRIGTYAFNLCSGITDITFGSSVDTIEQNAFRYCNPAFIYAFNRSPRYSVSCISRESDTAIAFVPCGCGATYRNKWRDFSVIREFYEFSYDIIANSSNPEMGSVDMTYSCPNAEVVATANEGYLFSHWSNGITANPYSLSLTRDTALVAYFIEDRDLTLTVESNDSSMGYVTGSGEYPYRQDVEISATANTGYIFSHWNDGNTDNPRTIQITSDTIFTAYFVRTYTIIVAVNDSLMGYTTGSGEFLGGQVLEISATANNGYHFSAWQDGCTENPRMVQIISDTIFTAYFEPDTYHIEVSPNNILYGTTTGSGSYNYGENITIAAVANEGYCFRRWQEDGNTQQSRTITVIGDANYTAYFTPNTNHYTITVVSNDPAMGSVSGSGSYLYGTTATIAAYARGRYRFVQWQDGNTQQHREITVTGDSTYTAYFGGNSSDNDDNGIDDILADNIKVYVNGRNIVIEGSLDESVMVYDVMGRTIFHDVVRAPITAPTAGVYMVKIGDAKARKVVILR